MLGLLSARLRGLFWLATAPSHTIFMLGGAGVHPREMVKEKNFNPGNAGAVFYYDILAPLAHLGLLTAYRRAEPQEQVQVAGSRYRPNLRETLRSGN